MVLPQQSNNSGGCLCTSLAWFWQRICCSRWEWPGYGCLSNSCASICRVLFSFFDHLIYCFLGSFILSYISWAQHTISCIHASHNRLTSLFRCISSDVSACLLVASLHYFAMVCSCHLPALCIGMEYLWVHILLFPILIAWIWLQAGCLSSVAFVVRMIFLCMFCRLINMCGLLQFFAQAKSICPTDPLVFNELGVMAYRNKE
jgi:hypothetical protein